MSNADYADGDSYDSLSPSLREQVEDAALIFAAVLTDTRSSAVGEIRNNIPPTAEIWIRSHAAEFGATVIRHYRRLVATG